MAKKKNEGQLSIFHIGVEDLVRRREELRASLRAKRQRLRALEQGMPEIGHPASLELWQKREQEVLALYRLRQELEREIAAEAGELERLEQRLRELNLPYGVVGQIKELK
jgi:predicted RNase H-like nuclease (RuvC/YqgF family)